MTKFLHAYKQSQQQKKLHASPMLFAKAADNLGGGTNCEEGNSTLIVPIMDALSGWPLEGSVIE